MAQHKRYPDPPYPRSANSNNNAKRAGWIAFHEGGARGAAPFPRERMSLCLAYEEGWDAAEAKWDAFRATHPSSDVDSLTAELEGGAAEPDEFPPYPPGIKLPEDQNELVRYAALGRSAEANGLAWFAKDGDRDEMLFQPPADYIAEQAVAKFIEGNGLSKLSDIPAKPAPVPMLLNCPSCGVRHIDEGEFADKPHHTHACQGCGMVWRPALVDTVGVKFLPGFKNDV